MTPRHFTSYTDARANLRKVFDSADTGRVTTVRREDKRFAVVDADRLLAAFLRLRPSRAMVLAEGGGWAAIMPGLPVHGDGATLDEAVQDLVDALREYAEDWNERLLNTPNHRDNWDVVELVELASDDQLKGWLLAADPSGLVPA